MRIQKMKRFHLSHLLRLQEEMLNGLELMENRNLCHAVSFQLVPFVLPAYSAMFSLLDPDGNQQSEAKDSSAAARKAVKRSIPKLDAHRYF
ncbi:UNVERIFIED_CONTAM: hypothetical protein H355_002946 [Colinus virginianus]|nr:hypothetical protein H355_002946 [Colinus virginianus]